MSNVQIKAIVVTVSDTRDQEDDASGELLAGLLRHSNIEVLERLIVTDDLDHIKNTLFVLTEREHVNLIVTTGGTGFAPRDNTPEATRAVIDREAPGIAEAIRAETLKKTPHAMLSRGVCGTRNNTLLINLPGSPKAVSECFEVIRPVLPHAINLICGFNEH